MIKEHFLNYEAMHGDFTLRFDDSSAIDYRGSLAPAAGSVLHEIHAFCEGLSRREEK